ncbi:MAG TPA: tetratricopeptide repeat protein [Steroidobacter sp.]|uniref:tetratricopeptide repeat protein n=1 Tax=Steroidobacter sp. TaxID=1978227 RepID=UPI002EDB79B6
MLTLALFLAGPESRAATDEANRQFRTGSTAFQAGDYARALDAFEVALASGMSGPAVHFNIGVAAYRLGDYLRAEAAFQEVARTSSMAALAYYNLGLVANARGDSTAATEWFAKVEPATTDERLRALAASRLAELQPQSQPPLPPRPWVGFAAFGLGHDDNVALVSDANVLGITDSEDNFADLQLALSTPLSDAWRVDGGLLYTDYQDLDTFDQLSTYAGARYRWTRGDWRNDAGLRLGYSLLDGSGFESRQTLSVQTRRGLMPDVELRGRYRFHHIDGLNEFSGLSGLRHEAGAAINWTRARWNIDVGYRFEIADYDDAALSATRHEVRADVERAIDNDWTVLLEASLRHSDYDADVNGAEDRTELALSVTRALSARWRLAVRHAYSENQADLPDFDYRGNRFSAGVEATF